MTTATVKTRTCEVPPRQHFLVDVPNRSWRVLGRQDAPRIVTGEPIEQYKNQKKLTVPCVSGGKPHRTTTKTTTRFRPFFQQAGERGFEVLFGF